MTNLTLILGGTRSGKSAFAEKLAHERGGAVLYVATAQGRPEDASMQERIRRHQERRPAHWQILECPQHPAQAVTAVLKNSTAPHTVLLDCVPLWLTNILCALPNPEDLAAFEQALHTEITALLNLVQTHPGTGWILVSGETGLGLVAPTAMGRTFCDGLGLANQLLAAAAREVWLVVAGRALKI